MDISITSGMSPGWWRRQAHGWQPRDWMTSIARGAIPIAAGPGSAVDWRPLVVFFWDFRGFKVDHWIDDGTELPVCGGLRAIHLPGHTDGHMGFLLPHQKLLFSGDLFANFGSWSHLPPRFLNSRPDLLTSSLRRALDLDLIGCLPNHGWPATPSEHLRILNRLAGQG